MCLPTHWLAHVFYKIVLHSYIFEEISHSDLFGTARSITAIGQFKPITSKILKMCLFYIICRHFMLFKALLVADLWDRSQWGKWLYAGFTPASKVPGLPHTSRMSAQSALRLLRGSIRLLFFDTKCLGCNWFSPSFKQQHRCRSLWSQQSLYTRLSNFYMSTGNEHRCAFQ